MNLFEKFLHFFTPRHTNNHKAKALHLSSIFIYISALLTVQLVISLFARVNPEILGYATNITVNDLLKYSNEERLQNGVSTLTLNSQLESAAKAKGEDMFSKQYWAHTSPTGADPWKFILDAGYNYLYAGENLARDFADSKSVVSAWINSPSHRENLLNPRYLEVGFAVINGKYNNYETTLVVQMFGTKQNLGPSVNAPETQVTPPIENKPSKPASSPGEIIFKPSTPAAIAHIEGQNVLPLTSAVKLDVFSLTKNSSLIIVAMLILVLALDAFLVFYRKTIRISSHNLAHMMLLITLLVILNLIGRGIIA